MKNKTNSGFERQITHNLLIKDKEEGADSPLMRGIKEGSPALKGPEIVQFDVTNRCNNNCLCCWNKSPLLDKAVKSSSWHNQELPAELVKKVIRDLSLMGTNTLFFAGGGEPLMHDDFLGILEEAKSRGMKTVINTNFTLINEAIIRKLVELKVDFIHASVLAGDPDVYVKIHPNKTAEDYLRIKKLLVFLADMKDEQKAWKNPHLNMYYVIFNKNYHQIEPMVELALEVRANSMEFVPIDVIPGETDTLLLNSLQRKIAIREMKSQIKRLKELQKKYPKPITFIEQADTFLKRICERNALKGEYECRSKKAKACYVGWIFSRIAADGTVYPCLKAERIPVGNIYTDSFQDICNSTDQRLFREKTIRFNAKDPYFWKIGNKDNQQCGCLVSCDNIQINLELDKRFKEWLKNNSIDA